MRVEVAWSAECSTAPPPTALFLRPARARELEAPEAEDISAKGTQRLFPPPSSSLTCTPFTLPSALVPEVDKYTIYNHLRLLLLRKEIKSLLSVDNMESTIQIDNIQEIGNLGLQAPLQDEVPFWLVISPWAGLGSGHGSVSGPRVSLGPRRFAQYFFGICKDPSAQIPSPLCPSRGLKGKAVNSSKKIPAAKPWLQVCVLACMLASLNGIFL